MQRPRHAPAGSARNTLQGRVRDVLPLVAAITPEAQVSLDCREGQSLYAAFKATTVSVSPR